MSTPAVPDGPPDAVMEGAPASDPMTRSASAPVAEWAAGPVRSVCNLRPKARIAGIDFTDPRNNTLDRGVLDHYLRTGRDRPELPDQLHLRPWQRTDVLEIPGSPGFLLTTRLRELLEQVAPGDLECHPATVNGQLYWLTRIIPVLDALARRGTKLNYDKDGQYYSHDRLTWKAAVLTRPAIFRIPQAPGRLWTTHHVAAAYLTSGYTGLAVAGPQGHLDHPPT